MATTTEKTVNRIITTPLCRFSYAYLFTPKTNDDGNKVWSVAGIFDESDPKVKAGLDAMRKLWNAVMDEEFGKNRTGKFKNPFRPGTAEEFDLVKNPAYKGKTIINFNSYGRAPAIVDANRQPIVDSADLVSGDWGILSVNAFKYDKKGSKGVAFGLRLVMKVRSGEPLVAQVNPEEEFKHVDTSSWGADNEDQFGDDEGLGV